MKNVFIDIFTKLLATYNVKIKHFIHNKCFQFLQFIFKRMNYATTNITESIIFIVGHFVQQYSSLEEIETSRIEVSAN